ncbi:hypothetical protein AVMA1855_18810 [Acidovorax sp. SUPP1855]|nr:hypothetical protein AVMA1855_18810 [Acidovorax sp. SUPP1855]
MHYIVLQISTFQKNFLHKGHFLRNSENPSSERAAHFIHQGALTGAHETGRAPADYRSPGHLAFLEGIGLLEHGKPPRTPRSDRPARTGAAVRIRPVRRERRPVTGNAGAAEGAG